jgi:tetratricopeptide (TPR) repeat protein
VAGLVYVDPTDFTRSRAEDLAAFREIGVADADSALKDYRQKFRSILIEDPPGRAAQGAVIDSLMRMRWEERGLFPAPEIPVAVLLSGKLGGSTPPLGMEVGFNYQDYWDVRVRQRIKNMDALALESPDGLFVVSDRAGHFVHHDAPDLVIEAIRHVLFPGVPRQLREALAKGGEEALTDTYQSLKRRYPPERFDQGLLNELGYTLLRMEQVENAIAVFELNAREYPEAPNPYDSLGDAYRAAGRLKAAKRHYERAVALAEEQGHPDLETFRANLKEVTKQIEEKN